MCINVVAVLSKLNTVHFSEILEIRISCPVPGPFFLLTSVDQISILHIISEKVMRSLAFLGKLGFISHSNGCPFNFHLEASSKNDFFVLEG